MDHGGNPKKRYIGTIDWVNYDMDSEKGTGKREERRWRVIIVGILILVALLGSLTVYRYFSPVKPQTVVGVVVHGDGKKIFLRLATDDTVNGFRAGEIRSYTVKPDIYEEIDLGDLVKGMPGKIRRCALEVKEITPFFKPPIINTGDYILLEDISLNKQPNSMYPNLHVIFKNLGEKKVMAMRVEINGTFIPFSFGITRNSPVGPSRYGGESVPTRWFDPELNETVGFDPAKEETYPVFIEMRFSDYSVQTWDVSVKATSFRSIATVVGGTISLGAVDLFRLGLREGGILSITFRNVWIRKTITEIVVFLDENQVMKTSATIPDAGYWAGSITLPFDVYTGGEYNVTVQVKASDGSIASVSRVTVCERI